MISCAIQEKLSFYSYCQYCIHKWYFQYNNMIIWTFSASSSPTAGRMDLSKRKRSAWSGLNRNWCGDSWEHRQSMEILWQLNVYMDMGNGHGNGKWTWGFGHIQKTDEFWMGVPHETCGWMDHQTLTSCPVYLALEARTFKVARRAKAFQPKMEDRGTQLSALEATYLPIVLISTTHTEVLRHKLWYTGIEAIIRGYTRIYVYICISKNKPYQIVTDITKICQDRIHFWNQVILASQNADHQNPETLSNNQQHAESVLIVCCLNITYI